MTDIQNRQDIEQLINLFYEQVTTDELIGHFFTQIVQVNWEKHFPVMYDYWETILLGNMKYKGNPMLKHIAINQQAALKPEHFARWLSLWEKTISENFEGETAQEAIKRAKQIGGLMQFKIG